MGIRRPYAVGQPPRRIKSAVAPLDAAELVMAAQYIALALPDLANRAETAGLQLVAQHLRKALQLADRVGASDPAQPQGTRIGAPFLDMDRTT